MKYALTLAPSDEALKKEHDKVRTDLIKAGHKASDLDALPPPDPPAGRLYRLEERVATAHLRFAETCDVLVLLKLPVKSRNRTEICDGRFLAV